MLCCLGQNKIYMYTNIQTLSILIFIPYPEHFLAFSVKKVEKRHFLKDIGIFFVKCFQEFNIFSSYLA